MTMTQKIEVKTAADLAAAFAQIQQALDAADPDGTFEIRVWIWGPGEKRPAPDRERIERAAVDFLAAWFNAHCMLPEEAPRLVGSQVAPDRALKLAMQLIDKIDELDLPLPPQERGTQLMQRMVDEQLRVNKVTEAAEAERLALLRDHNEIFHGPDFTPPAAG